MARKSAYELLVEDIQNNTRVKQSTTLAAILIGLAIAHAADRIADALETGLNQR